VGKGTVAGSKPRLLWEESIYDFLKEIQGVHIPVCLGGFSLEYPYYIGIRIPYLLLLSYAGDPLPGDIIDTFDIDKRIIAAVQEVEKAGVRHSDVRVPNLRWDAKAQRVVVINFERAWIKARGKPSFSLGEKTYLHSAWVDGDASQKIKLKDPKKAKVKKAGKRVEFKKAGKKAPRANKMGMMADNQNVAKLVAGIQTVTTAVAVNK
jgi:hypothetical protein